MANPVAKYWHTLRHLRPAQIYGRLWFRLYRPRPDQRQAPELRASAGSWAAPALRTASISGPETFRFMNETHRVVGPAGWNDPDRDKLWLYNLHYFDDLNATDAAARADWHRALLLRWVAENPPGAGNGWEPYPTSLRIVNWIKLALAGNALPPGCVQSLAVQTRWLRRRLEHHLLGNHLFANAKALVFAGAFFVGPEVHGAAGAPEATPRAGQAAPPAKQTAARPQARATKPAAGPAGEPNGWLALGQRLLARELREQIVPDGGHFERSPMYHAILLEDVLDLINLAVAYPDTLAPELVALCRNKALAMLSWLAVMCHPDGEISFFNDAALGVAPTLADLVAYGHRLRILAMDDRPGAEPVWLRESGYIRLAAGPAIALLDVAPVGPDYLPGHAHADTLSFELSVFGQRVIVNAGISRYGSGPERLAERGTAAHSTVQIDGADSSEVWGAFRVARRARVFDVSLKRGRARLCAEPCELTLVDDPERTQARSSTEPPGTALVMVQQVAAAHDGYRRLPGRPVHRRTWGLTAECCYVIDEIEGGYGEAVARFHLHPDIGIDMERSNVKGQSAGHFHLAGGRAIAWRVVGGAVSIMPDQWHPEFGLSQASRCLVVRVDRGGCRLDLEWGCGDPVPDAVVNDGWR